MRLVPKDWDEYNPILFLMGAGFAVGGGYALGFMGLSGPLVLWALRAIPAAFLAMGWILMTRQFHLWRSVSSRDKTVTR
jgi:hypothetical protein